MQELLGDIVRAVPDGLQPMAGLPLMRALWTVVSQFSFIDLHSEDSEAPVYQVCLLLSSCRGVHVREAIAPVTIAAHLLCLQPASARQHSISSICS